MPSPRVLWIQFLLIAFGLHATAHCASGQSSAPSPNDPSALSDQNLRTPHPDLPVDATWSGILLISIGGLILGGAVIAPVVRANMGRAGSGS